MCSTHDGNSAWQRSTKGLNTCIKEPVTESHCKSLIHWHTLKALYVCVLQWSWPTQSHTRLSITPNHHPWNALTLMHHDLRECGQGKCVCVFTAVGGVWKHFKYSHERSCRCPRGKPGYQCPCGLFWSPLPWPARSRPFLLYFTVFTTATITVLSLQTI